MFAIPFLLLLAHTLNAVFAVTNERSSQMLASSPGHHKSPLVLPAALNRQAKDQEAEPVSSMPSHESSQRTVRDTGPAPDRKPIRVLITDTCVQRDTQGDTVGSEQDQGRELDLIPGSPLVLTHRINLVPGSCDGGCEMDFRAFQDRLDKLEKEVTSLREKCQGPCCKQGAGPGCSECPNDCSDQGRCVGGKCVCFPGFTGPDCGTPACPADCSGRGRCISGKCVCDAGFTGPDCSEKACPNNCSKRGKCVSGQCVCNTGFTRPDCSEKSCPNNCNNRGRCVNGKCVCDSGFTGPDCADKACPNNCFKRGRCVNGKCVCNAAYTGPDCSEKACPKNCSKRGRCMNGKCVCDSGFTGSDCSEKACPNNCNKKGRCVNGQCVCDTGFTGLNCSEKTCPNNCNNRGKCVNGQCVCDTGFTGPDCSEKTCPNNCNNRGKCVNGQCVCDTGFTGPDCSEKTCPNNCNNRGKCVNGQCVCDTGFTGLDCSEKTCPNNCNNRGRCVNGQCVCDTGFTGLDCSEKTCPNNCNNRGRCVNGQCVCDTGFTGPDCSEKTCPNDCNNRGRCVNGQCVCDTGFTGPDCSEKTCPNDCNNRGRCVNGQCVCDTGFTGLDCSEKTCPSNCNNRGRCVNGQCVCDVGFIGKDCFFKSCPSNCNNRGRCMKGKCLCRTGFTGPDCSQCEAGFTGPDCSTALSAVGQLKTRDITDTAVTISWSPPSIQYDLYYITFTSKKEGDHTVTASVTGNLSSFTQTGLASGQEYTVSIRGEKEGVPGPESTIVFTTLISGPKTLRVVKTTSTTAVVQWDPPQGDIDRYRLSVSPSDAKGEEAPEGALEMTLPPERDSAHVRGLVAGQLYEISLVAQKGSSQSQPVTVTVTPVGNTTTAVNMDIVETVAMEDPSKGGTARGKPELKEKPERTVFYIKEKAAGKERLFPGSEGAHNQSKTELPIKAKSQTQNSQIISKTGGRVVPKRKPKVTGPVLSNGTKIVAGGVRRMDQGLYKHYMKKQPVDRKTLISKFKTPGMTNRMAPLKGMHFNLGKRPLKKINSTHSLKKSPEDESRPCNTIQGYSSGTHGSESLNGSPKGSNKTEHRSSEGPEVMEQRSVAGKNGTETDRKKCSKTVNLSYRKIDGNGNVTSKALGPDTLPSRTAEEDLKTSDMIHITKTTGPKTKANLLHSFNSPQVTKDEEVNESTTNNPQTATESSQDYHSQNQVSSTHPSVPSPFSTSSSGQTIKDKQETQDQLWVSHHSSSLTLSVRPLMTSVSTLPPTIQPQVETPSKGLDTQDGAGSSARVSPDAELHPTHGDKVNEMATLLSQNVNKTVHKIGKDTVGKGKVSKKKDGKMLTFHHGNLSKLPLHHTHIRKVSNKTRSIVRAPYHPSKVPVTRLTSVMFRNGSNIPGSKMTQKLQEKSKNSTRPADTSTKAAATPTAKTNNVSVKTLTQGSTTAGHTDPLSKTGPTKGIIPQEHDSSKTTLDREGPSRKAGITDQPDRSTSNSTKASPGLSMVRVQNVTSRGFILTWEAPAGMFKNFLITRSDDKDGSRTGREKDEGGDKKTEENKNKKGEEEQNKGEKTLDKGSRDPNMLTEEDKSKPGSYKKSFSVSRVNATGSSPTGLQRGPNVKLQSQRIPKVLPGTSRSLTFQNLRPQTRYSISLLGRGPRVHSKLHRLSIVTGPEPPSKLTFSNVTDSSFYVSWIRPKTPVTGFKVTYIHTQDGEPVSLSLNSHQSSVPLSALLPGSSYEVNVISTLDLDESDPVKGLVVTAPDPPTDLRVVNITDSRALLLWRPALATVDHYIVVYSPEKGSNTSVVKVSGSAVEQQLNGLQGSTVYAVSVSSQLSGQPSRVVTTRFTTAAGTTGRDEGPRDLAASQVTPRSTLLTWTAPSAAVSTYKLTYQAAGQDTKEVTVNGTATQHKLRQLRPASKYRVQLQGERQGRYTAAISTEFTTGTLRFPFSMDCSQELLNGIQDSDEVEIFPNGKDGPSALVYCDMETDGGGWTVIQRRMDGKTNFFRSWQEYSAGFGNVSGEFWIGNELLHNLTHMTPMALRVDLRSGTDSVYAHYSSFSVDTQKRHYALRVSGYSGTAGDSMKYHNGRPFSTRDRDPNPFITRCAMSYRGGWWYRNCHEANLNGLYDTHTNHQGVIWTEWKGKNFSIAFTEMKIRPSSFRPHTLG